MPNEGSCANNVALKCNADGSAYEDDGEACTSEQTCVNGACVPHQCEPKRTFCSEGAVHACADDGLSSSEVRKCSAGEYCNTKTATCESGVCAPNQPACDAGRATTCNADASGFLAGGTTCESTTTTCEAGQCLTHVCTPSTTFCQGQEVKRCSANGLVSALVVTCSNIQYCDPATAQCTAQICTPGGRECSGNAVRTCNSNGSAWTSSNCSASQYCDTGTASCRAQVCTPGTERCSTSSSAVETCNSNGSGWSSSACPSGQGCDAGSLTCRDNVRPTIVSVSPSGSGVTKNTTIVVTFSEPMNTATTASAITLSSGGSAVALTNATWSQNNTRVTLTPASELVYATGTNPTARTYTVTVSTSARDAANNTLATQSTTNFTTLRNIEVVVPVSAQRGYFLGDGEYTYTVGETAYVRRQQGGTTFGSFEDQWDRNLTVFRSSDVAAALSGSPTFALELYATSVSLSGATLTIKHVHSTNIDSLGTASAAAQTTSLTLSSFGAASSWWNIDVGPIFRHASFNLDNYTNNLQFLISVEVPASTPEGTIRTFNFGGISHANKPRLRISRLAP